MQEILILKLYKYLRENNRDILLSLQREGTLTNYLSDKIDTVRGIIEALLNENVSLYIIEERCMAMLTADLQPSRYTYIVSVLEAQFPDEFQAKKQNGILTYEVLNLLDACAPIFLQYRFSKETEDNSNLKNAIIETIQESL